MKKIIWIFGESGTGKKTLINSILDDNEEYKSLFGLNGKKVATISRTVAGVADEVDETISRNDAILQGIEEFSKSDNDVLLIKGQTDDLEFVEGHEVKIDLLNQCIDTFGDIEQEIILLEIPNTDILYDRMIHKDWWQEDPENYSKMFPRDSWDNKTQIQRDKVLKFKDKVNKIDIYDSTDGYIRIDSISKDDPIIKGI